MKRIRKPKKSYVKKQLTQYKKKLKPKYLTKKVGRG